MHDLSWQKKLTQGFSSAAQLLSFLELPVSEEYLAEQQFASRVPLSFARRMKKGNPRDPLLLQVLASSAELNQHQAFSLDPLQEAKANPLTGLIHKYHGRVLVTLTGACAVNCRYCFRRHFPYQANNPGTSGLDAIMTYIRADENISEVILSGGDPLLAANGVFKKLLTALTGIAHVHTLRIHTRIPVVFPERIDEEWLSLLAGCSLNKVVVLHTNHAQELDEQVEQVCQQLRTAGCHLLNQSVLLAGINDKAETLAELSQALFAAGVLPYYLHLLDKVQGAAHFDVSLKEAKAIHQRMQALLPGYLVPRLATEEPGKPHKTLLIDA